MVRLIKEVFKKYVLDPQMQGLDTEEKVLNFLFNYRTTCLDNGQFPSERVYSFKPKTDLDLINPKSHYKRQLTTPKHDDTYYQQSTDVSVHDPFTKLTAGDPVYYKNHNPTDIRRWLRAKFIKRLSSNIFQVSLGGRLLSAHRQQLRLAEDSPGRKASSIFISRDPPQQHEDKPAAIQQPTRQSSEDEDFYGFVSDSNIFDTPVRSRPSSSIQRPLGDERAEQPSETSDVKRRSRKRKMPTTPSASRRSKRNRVLNKNQDFVYF